MQQREFSLCCGTKEYFIQVPEGGAFQYATLPPVECPENPIAAIQDALDSPIGAPRIESLVRPGQKVCIICDDNTRPTPVDQILKALLPRLARAGVDRNDISIVLALGSHRPMTEEEILNKLGAEVVSRYRVLNSEFENSDSLVQVGTSELGTPIRVFKPIMESDIRIGIGSVVPHGCMGWSGGAKILYPGVTAADIVSEFHVMQGVRKEFLVGMVESPTRLAVEKWTKSIGLHYIINTVLDKKLRLYRVAAGHYIQAHRKAVEYAQQVYGIHLTRQPDVILTSAYPIYIDFWQCGKAVYAPVKVIKPGGELLVLASCQEGVGPHPNMLPYMGLEDGPEQLARRLQNGEVGEDTLTMAVGVSMGRAVRHCHTTWISDGLTAEDCHVGHMSHTPESQLQQALEQALAQFAHPFLLIIPEGGEAVLI